MIGTRLAHYEITAHLGSGGMGDVYQATDSKLGRSVAILRILTGGNSSLWNLSAASRWPNASNVGRYLSPRLVPPGPDRVHLVVRQVEYWYDIGMTTTKIAITLPEDQLARVHRAVRAGRADSVSGYITRVLIEQDRQETLRTLVQDLIAEYGEPTKQEAMWAKRVLARRPRA